MMDIRIRYKHWIFRLPFLGAYAGMVIYPFMLFKRDQKDIDDRLFRHELEHIYQVQKYGWIKFYVTYIWYNIRYGYRENPYEVVAREAADAPLTEDERWLKDGKRR
jgi:hypothetical protein